MFKIYNLILRNMLSVYYSAILVLGFSAVTSEYVESPCPGTFDYQRDGNGIFGVIHLKATGPLSSIKIIANFSISARLPNSYVGLLEPIGNNPHILHNFNQGVPINYRVDFPVTYPIPRVTAIVVNGNLICYGPAVIPGPPNNYVSTISLQHNLYLKGHGNPGYYNQHEQTRPPSHHRPSLGSEYDLYGPFLENGELYIDDRNEQNSWNTNNKKPVYEQTPATRPTKPDPQYYLEVTQPPPRLPPKPQQPVETFNPVSKPTTPPPPPPPPPQPPAPVQSSNQFDTIQSVQCGVVAGGNERVSLIFNGQSYERGDWPWLVAIYRRKDGSLSFICAGTLVSDRHVVTAAHCMRQRSTITSNKDFVVKIGVHNLEDWEDDITLTRTVSTSIIHESYDPSTLANDILVLKLRTAVEFNTNIRPACLWTGNADLSRIVGASGVVAGWGSNENGPAGQGEPNVVRIPIVSTAVCRASLPDFHKLTSEFTLCAGDKNGSGPCLGDSGGGLYLLEGGRWRLRGIVSLSLRPTNGDNSCNLDQYVVFTDSAKYYDWINSALTTL